MRQRKGKSLEDTIVRPKAIIKEMFIDRCLVCLPTPFENYFIIHLYYFIIESNHVFLFFLTLGTCFSMFVYICARFRFVLIGGNLTAKSTLSYGGIGRGEFTFQRRSCNLSFLYPPCRQSAPESLVAG